MTLSLPNRPLVLSVFAPAPAPAPTGYAATGPAGAAPSGESSYASSYAEETPIQYHRHDQHVIEEDTYSSYLSYRCVRDPLCYSRI